MNRFRSFLMLLGVIAVSFGDATEPPLHKKDTASLLRDVIQEINEMFFFNSQLRLELLKNHPETIPLLVEWEYQDWHHYDTSLTREKLTDGFNHSLNDDRLPLAFVVLKDSVPVGVISLDDKSEPEIADLEDGNPWGGSFHVIPEERNQGIGQNMAQALIIIAKKLGYEKIHFFTSNFQVVHWYTERGAKIIDTRSFRGHVITTLEYNLLTRSVNR
ncbi:MAG: GNAT family N-acetyltransferase [Verrucomicrobia bacterium]|nr:GNAT family N-acetyltransferase [Verrucomicrobiota bacterium]MDE3047435.1 GNAT family N-acetyltransferase [Verrucomicrobiota bacterium]